MTAQELTILIPWLVTGIVGIGSIFKYFLDLRSNNDYRAAQERIVVAKDAQIAEAQETGKSKDAHIALLQETLRSSQTAAEERLKAKDDRIEHLKSQSAPTALSVLNAQQELRDRVITDLQTQLADSQGSHARSEQDIEDLRDQLSLAQTTLAALEQAATAIRTESRSVPLSAALGQIQISATGNVTPPSLPIRAEIERAIAVGSSDEDDKHEPSPDD